MDAQSRGPEAGERAAPSSPDRYDLVIVGVGRVAESAVEEAARSGRRVAWIRHRQAEGPTGGQMTCGQIRWASIALRRLGQFASPRAGSDALGGAVRAPGALDFAEALRWVRESAAEPEDRAGFAESLAGKIDVYPGPASFVRHDALTADGRTIGFRRAVIATGSRSVPRRLDGIDPTACRTSSEWLELVGQPRRIALVGTGPNACAWAQAFRRLGSEVFLIAREAAILPDVHPRAVAAVHARLVREGIRLHLPCQVSVDWAGNVPAAVIEQAGKKQKIFFDQIVLDEACRPNTAGLELEAAGIASTERRIVVGDRLQTTNPRVFAAGEVCGDEFAAPEVADAMARACVRNTLGLFQRRFPRLAVPRTIWTDPQVVEIGLSPAEAAVRQIETETHRIELDEMGSWGSRHEAGFVEVRVARPTGRIAGACFVAGEAEELSGVIALCMIRRLPLAALAEVPWGRPSRFAILHELARREAQAGGRSRAAAWLGRCRAWWRRLRGEEPLDRASPRPGARRPPPPESARAR